MSTPLLFRTPPETLGLTAETAQEQFSRSRLGTSGQPRGAVLLGGAHGALALARSLGTIGVPVHLVTSDNPLPKLSRHIRQSLPWPGAADRNAVQYLIELARKHDLQGFMLVPCADAEVRMVAEARALLSQVFTVMLPDWEQLRWAGDKGMAYQRATELGLAVPETFPITSYAEAQTVKLRFPVVLKPTMRLGINRFTAEKAWRADTQEQFLALYREAASLVGESRIVVQELVPGGGQSQLSYAGLWANGTEILGFSARRTRQYPLEFSYTSTFVELVDDRETLEAARRFLQSINHHGLVEVEFKRDHRDNKLKLLDINPRPWSWFGITQTMSIDMGVLLWAVACGSTEPFGVPTGKASWMYLLRDAVSATQLIRRGELSLGAYLHSLRGPKAWGAFSLTDPLPGLLDLPLLAWRLLGRRLFGRQQ